MAGLVVCALGAVFGLVMFFKLRNLPVHQSMRDISELIYETCKTYLVTQGKFILLLGVVHRRGDGDLLRLAARHGVHAARVGDHRGVQPGRHRRQLRRGLVRHSHQHVCQLAGRVRQPGRQAVSDLRDSAAGRHQHRHAADQRRAGDHAGDLAVRAGPSLPGRASSASRSANRWARRRCGSPAASSPRSPTSAPT